MIHGRWILEGNVRRPKIAAKVIYGNAQATSSVDFLLDTGADFTHFGAVDFAIMQFMFGITAASLPPGPPVSGIGGIAAVFRLPVRLAFADGTTLAVPTAAVSQANVTVTPANRLLPSLLGRDVLSHFAVYADDNADRLILFERAEMQQVLFQGTRLPDLRRRAGQ